MKIEDRTIGFTNTGKFYVHFHPKIYLRRIQAREELFPDGFFELRKVVKYGKEFTAEEEESFWAIKRELKQKFMTLPANLYLNGKNNIKDTEFQ
jgi:hypothetical protein